MNEREFTLVYRVMMMTTFSHMLLLLPAFSNLRFSLQSLSNLKTTLIPLQFSFSKFRAFPRAGHRSVAIGIRAQNPNSNQPPVWVFQSISVHFEASVTADSADGRVVCIGFQSIKKPSKYIHIGVQKQNKLKSIDR
jgi:hypothetical protein